jgi:hypothetical protein
MALLIRRPLMWRNIRDPSLGRLLSDMVFR